MVEEWDMSADVQPKIKCTINYICLQNKATIIKISANLGKRVIKCGEKLPESKNMNKNKCMGCITFLAVCFMSIRPITSEISKK